MVDIKAKNCYFQKGIYEWVEGLFSGLKVTSFIFNWMENKKSRSFQLPVIPSRKYKT